MGAYAIDCEWIARAMLDQRADGSREIGSGCEEWPVVGPLIDRTVRVRTDLPLTPASARIVRDRLAPHLADDELLLVSVRWQLWAMPHQRPTTRLGRQRPG